MFDDREVRFQKPDGTSDSIAWGDIAEVGVLTTDEGPIQEDVFFMLLDREHKRGCAIPQGAAGTDVLLTRLQALPGFDNAKLIEAMGCTSNNRFVCWRRA
ncbi:hypothetical protein DB347_22650 [Opitutaceae bacterium EW11]|nr:hypothetical protein DB347_22650 [Opitutaceae bacterium EW11]